MFLLKMKKKKKLPLSIKNGFFNNEKLPPFIILLVIS